MLISWGQDVQPNRSVPRVGEWFRIFCHWLHFGGQRSHIFGLFGHDLQFDHHFFIIESFAFTQTCDYTIRHFIGSVGFYVQYLYFANHGDTLLFDVSNFKTCDFSNWKLLLFSANVWHFHLSKYNTVVKNREKTPTNF